jgi:uncharacterized protein YcfJ
MIKKILTTTLFLTISVNAGTTSYVEYVDVVKSKRTYENVITQIPHQECHNENVPTRYNSYQTSNRPTYRNDSGAAIVGGIIGGVLGHQIGKGHGKDAATIGGAIIGSMIGQNSRRPAQRVSSYNSAYDSGYSSCQTRRVCNTVYSERSERKFTGYKNIGYYKGRKIVKYSDRKLASIPINVTVSY